MKMNKTFKLNARQVIQTALCASAATFIMAFGGGRSGKTFNFLRNITLRALKSPGSRHAIFRRHFSHAKQSIILETWPTVVEKCFPGLDYRLDKTDWYIEFPNGAQIWVGGVDDKERMEKILGREYVTIYLNEVSEFFYNHIEMIITRLAQKCKQVINGESSELKLKCYMDCNPPLKSHWSFRMFIQKLNPVNKQPLANPDDYASVQMNPKDNSENIAPKYLEMMAASSTRMKKRFYDGEFGDENPNALFSDIVIDLHRRLNGDLPDMVRIIVGVDPSGADDDSKTDADAIGIVCGGLGVDGKAYLLEDATVTGSPKVWGDVTDKLYKRRSGDSVVCEKNFGGEMCRFVLQTANPKLPVKLVNASRGKVVRAEPFSSLYEKGEIVHAGNFPELEDEMLGFSTKGYIGGDSPNRADAWFWVLTELFGDMVEEEIETTPHTAPLIRGMEIV